MTKAELKSQFQNSYNRESWKPILKLVFGQINYFTDPFSLFEGVETVKQGCQIGYVDLPNNQTVAIFEIEVADSIIIERNRKGLRDIAEKFINGTFTAALVFYYSKNQTEYRFSFIAKQSKIDEQTGEYSTIVTAPKRYTYVLGTPFCATAAERWIKLAAEPEITVDKITDAFSVEKLSKEFFDQYKIQYTRFCKFIGDDSVTLKQFIDHTETDEVKAQKPLRDYVKKLLGRLVFLQFLQKKGWMGVPATNKDWKGGDLNFMANLFNKSTYQDNYLDQVLEPLFFNTLNAERTNDIAVDIDPSIKIPYLNGGLFEKTTLDDTHVKFPKHYFSELFEFFNQYNFTIDENDPDDAEVGIDPEMLGHIFENLLEDNKDKGAFYTPKEIVRYMCRESLIAYLHTHTPDALHPSVEKLIRTHKVDDCLQDKPNATLIQKLLVAIKICDPAIGSGAFPMGMLNEIFAVRRKLFGILGKNQSFSACLVKKEIIQNNIYGVDIEQGAVDIARLRFWLALVVDEDVPQALPNLDYKIMCGNSLISRFPLDAPIKDVFAEYNKKYKTNFTLQDYKNLVDEYTDVHNSKEQFRAKIEEIKGAFKSTLLNSDLVSRKKAEMEVLDYEMVDVFGERKADKDKKGYKAAKTKLEKYLKSEKDTLDNKLYVNSFEWRFEFPSLLDENGNFTGFDVVIGNPPYVNFRDIKNELEKSYFLNKFKTAEYQSDLYMLFIEKGYSILKKGIGQFAYIIPNSLTNNLNNSKIRKHILEQSDIISIVNTPTGVFEAATVDTIVLCTTFQHRDREIKIFQLEKKSFIQIESRNKVDFMENDNFDFDFLTNSKCKGLLKKIQQSNYKLDDICKSTSGIKEYEVGKGSPQQTKVDCSLKIFNSNIKIDDSYRMHITGSEVDNYTLKYSGQYIKYGSCLAAPRDSYFFSECDKIIIREIPGRNRLKVAYTAKDYTVKNTAHIFIPNPDYNAKYLCAILNSSLLGFYFVNNFSERDNVFPKAKIGQCRLLPIKHIPLNVQNIFIKIVDNILEHKEENLNTDDLEQQIDLLVYKLYELSYDEVLLIEPDFGKRVSLEEYEDVNVAEYETINVE